MKDICVVGGCGHVGLPLALAFANENLDVSIYDINDESVNLVNLGRMPFLEQGSDEILKKVISKKLIATVNPNVISNAEFVIIIVGTPVDEYLNPEFKVFKAFLDDYYQYFVEGQTIILRSTVFPGTTNWINNYFKKKSKKISIAFCPERIAEGKAMEELYSLPQIISAFDGETINAVDKLFSVLTKDCIVLSPIQAELAKLFTNSWRYIEFSVANQFYMLATEYGTDFYEIFNAMKFQYPRAEGFPGAGFAAGPCLFKDTMQLSSFSNNKFFLGHSAMLINEGLPKFIIEKLKEKHDLKLKTVGILGMAFKANSDDNRSSLSYKLKKHLLIEANEVLCHDVYIEDVSFVSMEDLLDRSDIIILGAPHKEYKDLKFPQGVPIVDVWNYYNNGGLI